MTRRRAGLLVFVIAALLLILAANQRRHLVVGSAQAIPVPGPPAIGTCVLDPLPIPLGLAQYSVFPTTYRYPQLAIQPCDGARYAEVVSMIAHPRAPVVTRNGNDFAVDYPEGPDCNRAAQQYLGAASRGLFGLWSPELQGNITMSRPSARQEAAGQHWAACVVGLLPTDGTTTIATSPRYDGSLRNALATGRERNELGSCVPDADASGDTYFASSSGACGRPHAQEVFGDGSTGARSVERVEVETTCRKLVGQLTGLPDPTAAGLSLLLTIFDKDGMPVTTPQIPAHSTLGCSIVTTDGKMLTGSLLARGAQPIPWARPSGH